MRVSSVFIGTDGAFRKRANLNRQQHTKSDNHIAAPPPILSLWPATMALNLDRLAYFKAVNISSQWPHHDTSLFSFNIDSKGFIFLMDDTRISLRMRMCHDDVAVKRKGR